MRKPILIETRDVDTTWPTNEIDGIKENLFKYLADFVPEKWAYSKHAIMGPAGKLLAIVASSKFGDNVDSYTGYICNIHDQQSKKHLTTDGMNSLRSAVSQLIRIKQSSSERSFLRIINSIDYGVYYLKMKEIAKRKEEKSAGGNKE
jgi:hypothetical protein